MILIIASILIAFALDSWWNTRQELAHRQSVLSALELDFETTRGRLATSIAHAESLITRSRLFLSVAQTDERIPVDSIRYLAGGAYEPIPFQPALSAYRASIATGDLNVLRHPELIEALTEFDQAYGYAEGHGRITAELFYLGASWSLRRELGSLSVLVTENEVLDSSPFQLDDQEYRELIRQPMVYAAIETVMIANVNILRGLQGMDEAAARILEEIDEIR